MKLLMENWRRFITEIEEPITTLRIFDFDETIAHTQSETRVTAPDGSTDVRACPGHGRHNGILPWGRCETKPLAGQRDGNWSGSGPGYQTGIGPE